MVVGLVVDHPRAQVALITVFNSLASLWGVPTSRRRRRSKGKTKKKKFGTKDEKIKKKN